MYSTFNMGIGFVIICDPSNKEEIMKLYDRNYISEIGIFIKIKFIDFKYLLISMIYILNIIVNLIFVTTFTKKVRFNLKKQNILLS